MRSTRHFVIGFATLYGVLLLMLLPALSQVVFYGDLTRIGNLSETQFGWKQRQPAIAPSLLESVPLAQADILVIGDSFSFSRSWQSVLVANGHRVFTTSWVAIGDALCKNTAGRIRTEGFKAGGMIIAESVQRDFASRLAQSIECKPQVSPARIVSNPIVAAPPELPPDQWVNLNGSLYVGLNVLFNRLRLLSCKECVFRPWKSKHSVRVDPVVQGCRYFSHADCDSALFLDDDRHSVSLDVDMVDALRKINESISEYRVLWLVVPDKTSVYMNQQSAFWHELERRNLGPNVLKRFQGARETVRDLYPGNESHLSTQGYLLMGKMLGEIPISLGR